MKNIVILSLMTIALVIGTGCKKSVVGKKVKEPFSSSKYESNNRFFRAVGKGVSAKDNIAKGKADIEAKKVLAGQVGTNVASVTDQYLQQTENEVGAELGDKFQSLVREVMNTQIADLRLIGNEKYYDGNVYTVFMAYEIKKNAMFRFLKKQAKIDEKLNRDEKKLIEAIIDNELEKLDGLED